MVGGLIFSQFLTLYITPVFFLYIEGLRTRIERWFPAFRTLGESVNVPIRRAESFEINPNSLARIT